MRGTEKQIKWATDLLSKMHAEFTTCKEIAPADFHAVLDGIEEILSDAYAGDIIDLLSGNHGSGQEYFKVFRGRLHFVHNNKAAGEIKNKYYTSGR